MLNIEPPESDSWAQRERESSYRGRNKTALALHIDLIFSSAFINKSTLMTVMKKHLHEVHQYNTIGPQCWSNTTEYFFFFFF